MKAALSRRVMQGLSVQTVIDVGASTGSWSKMAQEFISDAIYLLIEANSFHESKLVEFKKQNPKVEYLLAAAGDYVGELYFDAQDPFGGTASHEVIHTSDITVQVTTIDAQVKEKGLKPPFLMKLDTHGFEIPILRGAEETLKNTKLVIIEAYNFKLTQDCLQFWELCDHMKKKGFQPIDICDPMHRPKDQSFWQMDIFFIPNSSREFKSNKYN
ncbi:FkbM family methyltransferase [Methylotuvimicrobium sp. KM2]|uniref:FkbM family methyltransferase n=1 Tax=Methylotuvimicrobium sp. KM2 TaxID=3133976 RepID=UPI0031016E20